LLWLLFPLTGLHHLYLGRNRAALLASVSCGHFGVGWLCDALCLPRYAAELARAQARCTPPAPPPPARLRAAQSLCSQLLLGVWFFYHASRLLPRHVSPHAVSCLSGASAAVAVWLSATGSLSAWAASVWALLPVVCSGLASVAFSILLSVEWPHPAAARDTPSLRLKPAMLPLLVGVGVANLMAPHCNAMRKEKFIHVPRRSWKLGVVVAVASTCFWLAVLAGWLMRVPTEVSIDGKSATVDAWRLLSATSCVLRPDRLYTFFRQGLREPACLKRELVQLLGPFNRFCFMPQAINKCFDWDIFDTRWMSVGLTLKEAYQALNVKPAASIREIKMAHHRIALANHPDKVRNLGGADAAEAADKFMKVQRAFETIMESRKPRHSTSSGPSRE